MVSTAVAGQVSLADLGTPLSEVTFVVVDLETTGGSAATDAITEFGAVKVRGGEVLGEFQSLVNPGSPIPAFVTVLTGITDSMVVVAPPLSSVLPQFLEWASGAALVAHNAPFDIGFLRAACDRAGLVWPAPPVLDTARLARAALTRDEAPDCRLATLARRYSPQAPPTHRALDDARATVAVLHGLFERLGCWGVHTLEEARAFSSLLTPAQRRKRRLADGLPSGPGVYLFRDRDGRVLYAGRSGNVAARVRQYFSTGDRRTRMREMVALAERVDVLRCETALDAQVRELRVIAEHVPPYNRRSRYPERCCYLTLTREPYPRLSITRRPPERGAWLGPFATNASAELAREALQHAFPLRRCTQRLGRRPSARACALAELGRCTAPCTGAVPVDDYAGLVARVTAALDDPGPVLAAARARCAELALEQRYEEAGLVRDRLAAYLRGALRAAALRRLVAAGRLLAAQPLAGGGFDLALVERGRLLGAARVPAGATPHPYLQALLATAPAAGAPPPGAPPGAAATVEEVELVDRWLAEPGTRLVSLTGRFASPCEGALRWRPLLAELTPTPPPGPQAAPPLRPAR